MSAINIVTKGSFSLGEVEYIFQLLELLTVPLPVGLSNQR
jgi:hypothetical protein